jgi:hypothetical protein
LGEVRSAKTLTAAVEPIQPRWLRLADAVRYSGLSKGRLKELAQAREIVGGQDDGDRRGGGDGTWIFDRLSLDRWRLGQLGGGMTIEQHADNLAGSVLA